MTDAPTLPDFPLILPDGNGGWKPHERAKECGKEQVAAWCQMEVARCKASRMHFLTNWCCALDLQEEYATSPQVGLFPDWPHVRAVVFAMWPARDVLIEKSRRMMVSWTVMACVLHDLLFQQNWPIMTLSRVEGLVDNGGEKSTWESLHGKVRFLWDHLPPFLRGWNMEFRHLSIVNRDLNNLVQGFGSSSSPGRSGGFNRAILDEFAWVTHSEQAMAAITAACSKGKVLISTPHGRGNAFYRIRETARQVYPVETSR